MHTFPWAKTTELIYKKIFFIIEENDDIYNLNIQDIVVYYKHGDFNDLTQKINFYLNNDYEKEKKVNDIYKFFISKFKNNSLINKIK